MPINPDYNGKKIFIVDSSGFYLPKIKPDILLITKSPKINPDRIIKDINPKMVNPIVNATRPITL